jgi:dimethylargininase
VYTSCLRTNDEPIDVDLARSQHDAYVSALERANILVTRVPPDHDAPDCCFIEDTAVLWSGGALVTRSAAPTRATESLPIGPALQSAGLEIERMSAPACLDGGDVLRVGARLFVGLSERTNEAGVETLRLHAERLGLHVYAVEVKAGLHLKSAATALDERTVLVKDDGTVDVQALAAHGLDTIVVREEAGANVLRLGQVVLVSAAAPTTAEVVSDRGLTPVVIDISELHKGDGALTCLSLRQPREGCWCA